MRPSTGEVGQDTRGFSSPDDPSPGDNKRGTFEGFEVAPESSDLRLRVLDSVRFEVSGEVVGAAIVLTFILDLTAVTLRLANTEGKLVIFVMIIVIMVEVEVIV